MKFAYLIEPPFNYINADGWLTGCDVELARYLFAQLGIADFEPVETTFAELLPGLGTGRWRMTTGLFSTDERRKSALFSRPIWALPDGLLVRQGNPQALSGYRSIAADKTLRLAVIRDQFQHRAAVDFGIEEERIQVFETYMQAADAVQNGAADAYASVGRAHSGFIAQNPERELELVLVPNEEKQPAFGSFAVGLTDAALLNDIDAALDEFLGTEPHRKMLAPFGFSSSEIDMVAAAP